MRILLVEDEEKVARFISVGLKAERFAVDCAHDGKTGLQMATLNPYDLLIVDLMLPVVVLTARDALSDKLTNFESGADDYLTKPFAFAELLVRIKALLRRGAVPRANVIQIADLEIDRLAHQVRRNGVAIKLTAKEYGLLEYLATNAGRVLSRTMIVEHVWDQSFEGLTNIVDVYVRQLRAKIDEPFDKKLIHTVRSVGYVINENGEE